MASLHNDWGTGSDEIVSTVGSLATRIEAWSDAHLFIFSTREFEPSIQTIRKWVEQAPGQVRSEDRDLARRNQQLEHENARLKEERDILAETTA